MKFNRIFLVGCPRSGTTLLQSMVASHSQVISFPETHFFSKTLSINPLLRRIKLYGPGSRDFITDFLDEHGYSDIRPFSDLPPLCTHNRWCKTLLNTIDEMVLAESGDPKSNNIWGLEKTPRHLFYISSIQQVGYQNKFLHILRSGPDVVASLYLATQKYPEQWGGSRSIKKCISWWNNSIRESLKYQDDPNHLFATYEQLLTNPEKVLESLTDWSSDEILTLNTISKALGYSGSLNALDDTVSPRGYRIMRKIPRLPMPVIENLVEHFIQLLNNFLMNLIR